MRQASPWLRSDLSPSSSVSSASPRTDKSLLGFGPICSESQRTAKISPRTRSNLSRLGQARLGLGLVLYGPARLLQAISADLPLLGPNLPLLGPIYFSSADLLSSA
uniref:Uncharacterized protein n=1 Tax=Fagus sylvatica TaxID=28930 RepID=A0A2N9EV38_FAGSY